MKVKGLNVCKEMLIIPFSVMRHVSHKVFSEIKYLFMGYLMTSSVFYIIQRRIRDDDNAIGKM